MRMKMVCDQCGSEDVRCDAWAEWDKDNQQWTLAETYDNSHCNACDGETSISEVEDTDCVAPTAPA